MKATKKIVGAACALVAAVALSAGSTFAWFASNNSVSATGLNISVNTSSTFLLIGNSETPTAAQIRALSPEAVTTTFQAECPEAGLKPVAHETITSTTVGTANSTDGVWYTQIADASNASASTSEKTKITDLTGYVLTDVLYFTVKAGSGETGALTVETVTVEKDATATGTDATVKPVCVIFVCGTNLVEFKANAAGTAWEKVGDSNKLADKVTDPESGDATKADSVTKVDIYVYYDGNHQDVYTDNSLNLVGSTISASFQVADATASSD